MTSGGNDFNDITRESTNRIPRCLLSKNKNILRHDTEAASPSAPSL